MRVPKFGHPFETSSVQLEPRIKITAVTDRKVVLVKVILSFFDSAKETRKPIPNSQALVSGL
jgi:hypothetical protein